ncbi:MAG: hypothetical protein ACJ72D_17730 [Marmoricola sp.]
MSFLTRNRKQAAILTAGFAALGAIGTVAYAAIPSADGTFAGCVAKTNGLFLAIPHNKGDLRVVDATEACRSYESRVSWNQQGTPGQPGASAAAVWAVINPDGTVARGSHVIDSFRGQAGLYFVEFDRRIDNCAFSVTPDGTRLAGTTLSTPSQTQVEAFVHNTDTGQGTDGQVSVAVFC